MIEILRRKLADGLYDAARKGLARVQENSPLAQELKKVDVEYILKADIETICRHVSFFEMTRIMALVAQLNSCEHKNHGAIKANLKNPVIFDGRNLYDPKWVRSLGIEYLPIGW